MNIVLKPGGIALVVLAITGLTILVISQNKSRGAVAATSPNSAITAPKSSAANPTVPGKEMLVNGDFESDFLKYQGIAPTETLNISGNLGQSWEDNSGWAKIAIAYDKDTQNPHSGLSSQKMTVSKKRFGHAQITQAMAVPPGTKLTATVWLRVNKPMNEGNVDLWLRDQDDPAKIYGRQLAPVTTQWQPFTVSGTTTGTRPTVFMVLVTAPDTTVWLDDASVKVTP